MLLLSTSSFKWYWLHKIFKLASSSWFDWLNLDLSSWDYDAEDVEYVKSLSDEFKFPVLSITAYERKMDSKTVDDLIEKARILWAGIINFYPPFRQDKDTIWFSEYLSKAQENNKDIFLTVINVEPKTFLFFIPEYKDATLSTIKKMTWFSSLNVSNVDPSTWVDLLKSFSILWNSIRNVYLSDKTWLKTELLLWKGDMPLRDLLWKLKDSNYNYHFTLKVSPKELWVWHDETVLQRISDQKTYFDKHFTKA